MDMKDDLLGPIELIEVLKSRAKQLRVARPNFVVEVERTESAYVTVETKIESRVDGSIVARIIIKAA